MEPMTSSEATRVRLGDPVYNEILEFLYREAALLDAEKQIEWLDLLAEDISYRMPVRVTVTREGGPGFAEEASYFDDDLLSLSVRVRRNVESGMGWSEIPPTRSRRFVTNLEVEQVGEELQARSSVLMLRSRWDQSWFEFLSAQRHDVLRHVGDELKLARREIFVDQAVMDGPNLSVLL